MVEIPEAAVFDMDCRRIQLTTGAKGDQVVLDGLSLSDWQAGTLAWLINHSQGTKLEVEIKVKP